MCLFFFFQAEDGIRDGTVTGVQTCALPIYTEGPAEPTPSVFVMGAGVVGTALAARLVRAGIPVTEIGRASCRERVQISAVAVGLKTKKHRVPAELRVSLGRAYAHVDSKLLV